MIRDSDEHAQQSHTPREKPFIKELEDNDMGLPSLQGTPMDDNAVLPPRVIDKLLQAPD